MAYTTINKSTDHFNTKLHTGNGAEQAITGVGFQPDWTWIKKRNNTAVHYLFDAVRGATYFLNSDQTYTNQDNAQSLKSFDSDGFTLGTMAGANNSSDTFVSWNWKANGAGSANTDGSINTTATSVNTTAGTSIIKYSGNGSAGATIGHGLGVAPKCVIIKRTDTTSNWIFGHEPLGFNKFLYLNTQDQVTTNAGAFNDTAPSSSVITLGSWNDVNNSSGTYICYAFAEKQGFSKFGQYKGNGNANGPFIYTGFKPAFVFCRFIDAANGYDFVMIDNKRPGYNVTQNILEANTNDAENTNSNFKFDFLSNGFKFRGTESNFNDTNYDYIYWAIAEAPLVGSNNIPANAR
jgi:hypothetical protein